MDEKRLKEIEERWRKQLPLKIGEIDDLLAEVKRLRELLREVEQYAILPDSVAQRVKEVLDV